MLLPKKGLEQHLGREVLTGRLQEAMPHYLKRLDYMGRASAGGADFSISRSYVMAGVARRQAELGIFAGA